MEYQKSDRNRKTADDMRRNGPSQHRRDDISWNIYKGQHLHPTAYKGMKKRTSCMQVTVMIKDEKELAS